MPGCAHSEPQPVVPAARPHNTRSSAGGVHAAPKDSGSSTSVESGGRAGQGGGGVRPLTCWRRGKAVASDTLGHRRDLNISAGIDRGRRHERALAPERAGAVGRAEAQRPASGKPRARTTAHKTGKRSGRERERTCYERRRCRCEQHYGRPKVPASHASSSSESL